MLEGAKDEERGRREVPLKVNKAKNIISEKSSDPLARV